MKTLAITLTCLATLCVAAPLQADEPAADAALERTRKQIQIFDGIYKNGIVLITDNYVTEESDMPAGTAFKKLFEVAKQNGWHEVRLLDATGDPYNDENTPLPGFEQRAVAELKKGKAYYDEVVTEDGKRYLQAATIVPVVMPKCVMCHDNYEGVAEGAAIGALGYKIAIE